MFTLIDLPYASLAPVISDETLGFHHGKHLQTYVDNLNKLLPGTEFEGLALEDIVRQAPAGAVFNNAGQILNHNLYFTQFKTPDQVGGDNGVTPGGDNGGKRTSLREKIMETWGSMEAFQEEFEGRGTALFGSGWVWLAADGDGALCILQCPGADNPVARGLKRMLTFDVWEHAYYLDYQNRRAAHLKALWQLVDWSVVERRYSAK